jgi:prevent-host-death family protein
MLLVSPFFVPSPSCPAGPHIFRVRESEIDRGFASVRNISYISDAAFGPDPREWYTSRYTSPSMARQIPLREVRDNLGRLVDEVEAGDEIEITCRGKAAAVLLGIGALEALRAESSRSFEGCYDRFVRASERHRHGVDPDLVEAIRERPAWTGLP